MGRHCGGCHIVCRVLHRGKRINLLPQRKDDNSARVLSCRPLHPHTAGNQAVNLTGTLSLAALLKVFFNIAVSRLIRQRTHGSRPERLPFSKDNFGVIVGLTLVFAGEIQVNIRFLIAFKAQKRFKRNVKSLFFQRFAAHRTGAIRHITACHTRELFHLFRVKIIEVAGRTDIMRT